MLESHYSVGFLLRLGCPILLLATLILRGLISYLLVLLSPKTGTYRRNNYLSLRLHSRVPQEYKYPVLLRPQLLSMEGYDIHHPSIDCACLQTQ